MHDVALSKKQLAQFWAEWDETTCGPKSAWFKPPDNTTRRVWEQHLGVRLPDALFAVLRIQNGGMAIVGASPFLPLLLPTTRETNRIQTLTAAAGQTVPCGFEDLVWIAEDFGNPDLIVPLETDGHCFHALNYGAVGPQGEPTVVFIDLEGRDGEVVADSFADWVEDAEANQSDR
jgi:hypothetical protein